MPQVLRESSIGAAGGCAPYPWGVAADRDPDALVPPDARTAILAWYATEGRPLAFRATSDPYAVLVSELMAQQTQAERAAEAWTAWIARWPTAAALAAAPVADVLRAWAGLGYNRRALALHRAARVIVAEHAGRIPDDVEALERLPGVGPYTARAVAAIAFGRPVGAVDTNVRRVLGPGGRRRTGGLHRSVGPGPRRRRGAGGGGCGLDPCPDGRRGLAVRFPEPAMRRVSGRPLVPVRGRRSGCGSDPVDTSPRACARLRDDDAVASRPGAPARQGGRRRIVGRVPGRHRVTPCCCRARGRPGAGRRGSARGAPGRGPPRGAPSPIGVGTFGPVPRHRDPGGRPVAAPQPGPTAQDPACAARYPVGRAIPDHAPPRRRPRPRDALARRAGAALGRCRRPRGDLGRGDDGRRSQGPGPGDSRRAADGACGHGRGRRRACPARAQRPRGPPGARLRWPRQQRRRRLRCGASAGGLGRAR